MMVESALPLKHISLVELITTERTGALEKKDCTCINGIQSTL